MFSFLSSIWNGCTECDKIYYMLTEVNYRIWKIKKKLKKTHKINTFESHVKCRFAASYTSECKRQTKNDKRQTTNLFKQIGCVAVVLSLCLFAWNFETKCSYGKSSSGSICMSIVYTCAIFCVVFY